MTVAEAMQKMILLSDANFRDNPISMLYIWEGGLAIYGGIIGGAITVLVLSRVKRIPQKAFVKPL